MSKAVKKPIVTNDNYFSKEVEQAYFTNSQIKQYMKCNAKWQAKRMGIVEEKEQDYKSPLFQGSYVDMALTEPDNFPQYCIDNADKIYGRGSKKFAGIILLDKLIARVQRDKYFMSHLEGTQQEIIVLEDFYGHPFKCKLDALNLDKLWLTDLKTTGNGMNDEVWTPTDDGEFVKVHWIAHWKYPMQLALYREATYHKYMVRPHPYIAAVGKKDPPDFEVYDLMPDEMSEEILRAELARAVEAMNEMALMVDSHPDELDHCGKCDYCLSVKVLDAPKPFTYSPKMLRF